MTCLTDPQVGEVCRKAGFVGDDLATAIAVGLTASGANPGYDHAIWPGPVAHYKGLFGVDTVQWPQVAGSELHSPWVAADVAYELTKRYGWGWNPTARSGMHLHAVDRARVAGGMLPYREQSPEPVMVGHHARALAGRYRELQDAMVALDHNWRG